MKFCIAVLLLSSLYLATALPDAPWVHIPKGIADNSPYTLALNGLTGLNSLGQAFDSGIFGNRGNGQVSNVYNSWYQKVGDAFSYIAEQQLTLEDGSLHNSKSAISIDPETGRRNVVWWSLQQLTGAENFTPGGRNITYDADTDVVTVTTFEGLEQWLTYQSFQPINASDVDNVDNVTVTNPDDIVVNEDGEVDVSNPDDVVINEDGEGDTVVVENPDEVNVNEDGEVEVTNPDNVEANPEDPNVPTVEVFNSLGDYLQNFAGYVPQNVDTFADDEFLSNAGSNGVGQFSEGAGLANVNLANPLTLDTFDDQLGTTFVRLVGDVTSDTDSGQITAVVRCATGSDCSDGPLAYWWWNNVLLG